MTDTTRKTPQAIDPNVGEAIIAKRDALLNEQAKNRAERARLAQRDREIDGELADVQAAGRVFGIEVVLPKKEDDGSLNKFWTTTIGRAWPNDARRKIADALATVGPLPQTAAARAVATKAEMPRVSDIVLDRLKTAGAKGSKAAPIQDYIETTYGTKIHDKTVGMTLYRLQKDGRVRRRGHTWFIVRETVNPGAVTPGLENLT